MFKMVINRLGSNILELHIINKKSIPSLSTGKCWHFDLGLTPKIVIVLVIYVGTLTFFASTLNPEALKTCYKSIKLVCLDLGVKW